MSSSAIWKSKGQEAEFKKEGDCRLGACVCVCKTKLHGCFVMLI